MIVALRRYTPFFSSFGAAVAALIISALLTACANERSIFRSNRVNYSANTARILTEDARERNIIVAPAREWSYETGKPVATDIWRSCAEPPPDVFTAQNLSVAAD